MKIAICDDKMPIHQELKRHLQNYAQKRNLIFLYTDFTNGNDLLISRQKADIIFLDYQMEEMDGLETAKKLRESQNNTPIIFLTSFPHIVFDTFAVNAYRFLVKPIDTQKLEEALDAFLAEQDDENYIIIKDNDCNKRINIDDIIYAEASDKYCFIRTVQENFIYKKTLAEFEKILPEEKFFRSHRTYLVGFRHIVSYTETSILFDNHEKALISKLKRTPFKKAFQDYIKRYHFANR